MKERLHDEVHVAMKAVRLAARVCQSVQASISRDAIEKKDKSPVTVADFASQAIVCRALREAFSNDAIIGEEDATELRTDAMSPFRDRIVTELAGVGVPATGDAVCDWIDHGRTDAYRSRFWTLDPIDGTKGFLRGEQYAVSLALIVDGRIEIGVLGCPNLAENTSAEVEDLAGSGALFVAVRGRGTNVYSIADESAARQPIAVSSTGNTADARFCESVESGHSAHDDAAVIASRLGISRQPLRLDSQAKYAVVADGRADIYLRLPTRKDYVERIWDHAGGVLVVEEAGGTVTDVAGKPLDFTQGRGLDQNRGVIVTNGRLHEHVLAAVAAVLG